MKFAIGISALALALSGCAGQQSGKTDAQIEEEVRARFATLAEAAQSLDHEAYLAHFDDAQFTALNADGTITDGFEEFKSGYIGGVAALAAYRELTFANVSVTPMGSDAAILVNEYEAEVELRDGSPARFAGAGTQVWQLQDSQWKLVHVSSSMKQP